MRSTRSRSGRSRSRRSAFCASLFARGGLFVDLEEQGVDPARRPRRGERLDVLGPARGHPVAGPGALQAVGDVEHHGDAQGPELGERPEVNDQVVIAEADPALGDEHPPVAGPRDLGDGVAHVRGGEELALLEVYGAAGAGGGGDQVGLAREERGDLEDVRHLRRRVHLRRLVDVGQDRHPVRLLHRPQHPQARLEAGAAERADGGAVGLVERRLEDVGDAEVPGRCRRRCRPGTARAPRSR